MKSNLIKTTLAAAALASLGLLATAAQADWGRGHGQSGPGWQQNQQFARQINARQDRQTNRIQTNLRAGKLTRAEFRGLMQEQQQIRAMERHFRADGVIDAREFRRLDRALDVASRNIQAQAHNRQVRYAHNLRP